jgi:hypothetical protein
VRPESVENNNTVAMASLGYTSVASAHLQEGIMHPTQRRERLQFETTSQQANAIKKRGEMKERRLVQLMYEKNAIFAHTCLETEVNSCFIL